MHECLGHRTCAWEALLVEAVEDLAKRFRMPPAAALRGVPVIGEHPAHLPQRHAGLPQLDDAGDGLLLTGVLDEHAMVGTPPERRRPIRVTAGVCLRAPTV